MTVKLWLFVGLFFPIAWLFPEAVRFHEMKPAFENFALQDIKTQAQLQTSFMVYAQFVHIMITYMLGGTAIGLIHAIVSRNIAAHFFFIGIAAGLMFSGILHYWNLGTVDTSDTFSRINVMTYIIMLLSFILFSKQTEHTRRLLRQ